MPATHHHGTVTTLSTVATTVFSPTMLSFFKHRCLRYRRYLRYRKTNPITSWYRTCLTFGDGLTHFYTFLLVFMAHTSVPCQRYVRKFPLPTHSSYEFPQRTIPGTCHSTNDYKGTYFTRLRDTTLSKGVFVEFFLRRIRRDI